MARVINPDSELFGLDSDLDLDSELESKNPVDSGRFRFGFQSRFKISVSVHTPANFSIRTTTSWIRIRIRIQSSWIRIRIRMQEKRGGFGFSPIQIQGVWIRIRIQIRDAWIHTSLFGTTFPYRYERLSIYSQQWNILHGPDAERFVQNCNNHEQ